MSQPPTPPTAPSARSDPSPPPHAHLIDFSSTALSGSYPNHFALIIDNFLTAPECHTLLSTLPSAEWDIASVSIGNGEQRLQPDRRQSKRHVVDDPATAGWVWQRLEGYLRRFGVDVVRRCRPEEEEEMGEGEGEGEGKVFYGNIMVPVKNAKKAEALRGETWKMKRLNERLRYLKYHAGDFFVAHTDGSHSTTLLNPTQQPEQRSFLTLQLYLSSSPDLIGGATCFHPSLDDTSPEREVRVEAVQGRALLFQHRGMVHSGERVEVGEKVTVRTEVMFERVA